MRRSFSSSTEDSINHNLWVISYADMVTLLFALFVVLYSFGEVKLNKLRELRQSLAFAFSHDGDVVDIADDSIYDHGDRVRPLQGLELLYGQDQRLRQLLLETLPRRFEQITGHRLEVIVDDEGIEFRGPLAAYFAPGVAALRADVQPWLNELVDTSLGVAPRLRVRIEAANVTVAQGAHGRAQRSGPLCLDRLQHVLRFLPLIPRVLIETVETEFAYSLERGDDWERSGWLAFAFSSR